MTDPRAHLPAVTSLLARPEVAEAVTRVGHRSTVEALRAVLDAARSEVAAGKPSPTAASLSAQALERLDHVTRRGLRPVINGTGVLLHTNLGRAPLSDPAIGAMVAAAGATNLEIDLEDGRRGGRASVVQSALARLTGAEAALVVNNGAAALVLALGVLGQGREVIISRGELVEIGGSFRLPSIMESAGCLLREVGTTNRTRVEDYRDAIGETTGAILRVHPSNYHIAGFTHRPRTAEVAEVARAAGVPFIDDIGSGLLVAHRHAPDEPVAGEQIAAGADVVIFSGDKLLGGPQAGVLVGRREPIERCRRAPLARALRIDKLRLAALEATLASYSRDRASDDLPLWRLADASDEEVHTRAERLAEATGGQVVATEAVLGGGSTPGNRVPSWGVALPGDAESLGHRLRTGDPAVVARIMDGRLVVDLRSVPRERDADLDGALRTATGSD